MRRLLFIPAAVGIASNAAFVSGHEAAGLAGFVVTGLSLHLVSVLIERADRKNSGPDGKGRECDCPCHCAQFASGGQVLGGDVADNEADRSPEKALRDNEGAASVSVKADRKLLPERHDRPAKQKRVSGNGDNLSGIHAPASPETLGESIA